MRRGHLFDLEADDATDDPLARERRSALVSGAALLLLGVLMLAAGIVILVAGLDPYLGCALIGVSFVRFAGVPLTRHGYRTAAFLSNIGVGLLLYAGFSLELGPNAGLDVWAPSLVALPPMVAERRHRALRGGLVVVTLLTVFGTAVVSRHVEPRIIVAPETLALIRRINLASAVLFTAAVLLVYRVLLDQAEKRFAAAQKISERLLANILPGPIATRLKRDEYPIADRFHEITVLFADIVNFTGYAASHPPEQVVEMLNRVFYAFDDMVERRGLEKIKTIGDAYMVAAGVPVPRPDHAEAIAELAFEMLDFVAGLAVDGLTVELRIGIHSGRAVAGVIGKHKFSYDIWGDTVNEAARLQASSEPGRIQISAETARRLGPGWQLEPRGEIELKGLGEVATYFLIAQPTHRAP
jgi:class 3 adenylate cyclase